MELGLGGGVWALRALLFDDAFGVWDLDAEGVNDLCLRLAMIETNQAGELAGNQI